MPISAIINPIVLLEQIPPIETLNEAKLDTKKTHYVLNYPNGTRLIYILPETSTTQV